MYLYLIILTLTWSSLNTYAVQIPEDIPKCRYGDEKCILKSANQFIRQYAKGSSEYGLPAIDSIRVEDLTIADGGSGGPLWIRIKLINQLLKGFENATVTSLTGFSREPEMNKMEIKFRIPSLVMHGNFEVVGHGLLVYTNASGTTKSDMQNTRITATIKTIIEYRNNKRYLKIYDLVPELEMKRWILVSDNLYKENSDLTILINRLINDNWLVVWNYVESTVMPAYSRTIKNLLNSLTSVLSYDDWFLPD